MDGLNFVCPTRHRPARHSGAPLLACASRYVAGMASTEGAGGVACARPPSVTPPLLGGAVPPVPAATPPYSAGSCTCTAVALADAATRRW